MKFTQYDGQYKESVKNMWNVTFIPGHAKIRHFHLVILCNETVPGGLQKEQRKD